MIILTTPLLVIMLFWLNWNNIKTYIFNWMCINVSIGFFVLSHGNDHHQKHMNFIQIIWKRNMFTTITRSMQTEWIDESKCDWNIEIYYNSFHEMCMFLKKKWMFTWCIVQIPNLFEKKLNDGNQKGDGPAIIYSFIRRYWNARDNQRCKQ